MKAKNKTEKRKKNIVDNWKILLQKNYIIVIGYYIRLRSEELLSRFLTSFLF